VKQTRGKNDARRRYNDPCQSTRPDPWSFRHREAAPQGRDLLVQVKAISVNPVDTKVRKRAAPKTASREILGYDATGVVAAVGRTPRCSRRATRSGMRLDRPTRHHSEFHLVDERIVGRKPKSLGFAAAAALPLTSITRGKCCSTASACRAAALKANRC